MITPTFDFNNDCFVMLVNQRVPLNHGKQRRQGPMILLHRLAFSKRLRRLEIFIGIALVSPVFSRGLYGLSLCLTATVAVVGLWLGGSVVALKAAPINVDASTVGMTTTQIGPDLATTVTLDLSGSVPFSVFTLTNPPRVVVDMPEITFRMVASAIQANAGPVAAVRYGQFQPGNARLVFELNRPAVVRAAVINQRGNKWRLAVVLSDTTPENFAYGSGPEKRQGSFMPPVLPINTGVTTPPKPATPTPTPTPAPASAASPAPPTHPLSPPVAPPPTAPPPAPLLKTANNTPAPSPVVSHPVAPSVAPSVAAPSAPSVPPPVASVAASSPSTVIAGRHKPIIVLDPGHGGIDPGTTAYNGAFEKNIVLAAAREIQGQLLATGRYEVYLTRESDVFVPLRTRMEIGRHRKADVFISLHVNQVDDASVKGLSVYTLSDSASDDEAGALADAENKADIIAGLDLSRQSLEVTSILIDLAQRETLNLSSRLAEDLMAAARVRGTVPPVELLRSHPHRFAGFAVLKAADVPSMLIEMGYGSNPTEGALLQSDSYRHAFGQALTRALDAYFKHRTVLAGP